MTVTPYYIVVSRTDPDYATIIADCTSKQDELTPNNNLAVSPLNDGTDLIKIGGGSDTWKDAQSWAASVIIRFLSYENDERMSYYYARQDAEE